MPDCIGPVEVEDRGIKHAALALDIGQTELLKVAGRDQGAKIALDNVVIPQGKEPHPIAGPC